jgi:hypothetical protein
VVSWEESEVDPNESSPEVEETPKSRDFDTKSLFPPIVKSAEDSENSSSRENIVEVGNNVESVMEGNIKTTIRKCNSSETSSSEEEEEPNSKEGVWLREISASTPSRSSPGEDLDSGRNGNNSGRGSEVGTGINVKTDSVSVVSPNKETEDSNRDSSVNSTKISENRLSRSGGKNLAQDSESRKNKDINFRVTEEPEEVLVEDRVSAGRRVVESSVEITVGQKSGNTSSKNWEREKEKESGDQNRPNEEGKLVSKETWSTSVENGNNKVNRPKDRRRSGKVEGEDRQVNRRTRVCLDRRKRGVHSPTRTSTSFHESRGEKKDKGRGKEPEGNVVSARESSVRGSNSKRNEPVPEPTNKDRSNSKKDSEESVGSNDDVVELVVAGEDLGSSRSQFSANNERSGRTESTGEGSEENVKSPDVLVVGRSGPTEKGCTERGKSFRVGRRREGTGREDGGSREGGHKKKEGNRPFPCCTKARNSREGQKGEKRGRRGYFGERGQ